MCLLSLVHIRTRGTGFVEDALEHPSDASMAACLVQEWCQRGIFESRALEEGYSFVGLLSNGVLELLFFLSLKPSS